MALRERDLAIIEHVQRYRMTTNQVLHHLLFPTQSMNAVTKVTARLCDQEWLTRYPLLPPETYFTIGPTSVRQLGLHSRLTASLGPQALPIHYAVLIYAALGQQRCVKLTAEELAERMPWLSDAERHAIFTLTNDSRLDLIRVDLGGSPRHVARKAATDVATRLSVPELSDLASEGRFQLTILTTTQPKARLIATQLGRHSLSSEVRVHLAVIPRLTYLQLRGC